MHLQTIVVLKSFHFQFLTEDTLIQHTLIALFYLSPSHEHCKLLFRDYWHIWHLIGKGWVRVICALEVVDIVCSVWRGV